MRPMRTVGVVALWAAACGPSDRSSAGDPWTTLEGWETYGESAVNVVGFVEHRALEGGMWLIREPSGATWSPVNLPDAFQIEGAGVVADVRLRPDLLSIGMSGELVEVLRIRHGAVPDAPEGGEGGASAAELPEPVAGRQAFGEWRVVGHVVPGVSAMTSARAASWTGRSLEFGPRSARSPNGDCVAASFTERVVSTDALLSGQYGVPVETVPPLAALDEVTVIDVLCDGASWGAVGQTVLVLDERRAMTPWDGVFFELRRVR